MQGNGFRIYEMDKTLMLIYGIKNIEEISFSDLLPTPLPGKQFNVLPSLYVKFDGGKYLNLCSKDKYFDIFVKKVFEVYQKEKDREIIDTRFGPFSSVSKIRIDEKTKKILESGDLTKINEVYKMYDEKKSYDDSLLFQIDELRVILPIFKYHIKQLFDNTDLVINFENNYLNGYRNKYTINCKINGIDEKLLLSFERINSNEVYILVRSYDNIFSPFSMKLNFGKNYISVESYMKDCDLYSSSIYTTSLDTINYENRILKNGVEVIYSNGELPSVDNPYENISRIDNDFSMKWFKMPWNGFYGVNNSITQLSSYESLVNMHNKYLGIIDDEFLIRENTALVYHQDRTFDVNEKDVVLDEVNKSIIGIKPKKDSDYYIVETSFYDDVRKSSYYDTYLSGKHYYHVIEGKELLDIDRSKLISISTDNNIICGADLFSTYEIKKMIRGV